MNKLTIIGNLTNDPELRTTPNGKNVCSFSVAVNRRRKVDGQPDADFFRVSAWNQLGENCSKFLSKGRKVAVTGPVSVHAYESNGQARATMDVQAEDVEFLSPRSDSVDKESGFQKVQTEENPFEETPY